METKPELYFHRNCEVAVLPAIKQPVVQHDEAEIWIAVAGRRRDDHVFEDSEYCSPEPYCEVLIAMHEVAVHDALVSASLILNVGIAVIVDPLDKDCVVVAQLASSTEAIDATISTRTERIVVLNQQREQLLPAR